VRQTESGRFDRANFHLNLRVNPCRSHANGLRRSCQ
jgi:hypothetical protein